MYSLRYEDINTHMNTTAGVGRNSTADGVIRNGRSPASHPPAAFGLAFALYQYCSSGGESRS